MPAGQSFDSESGRRLWPESRKPDATLPTPPHHVTPEPTPEVVAGFRELAVQQLVRAARELAFVHLERCACIHEGRSVPICDRCRAMLQDHADIVSHRPKCPVGRVLAFAREIAICDSAFEAQGKGGAA